VKLLLDTHVLLWFLDNPALLREEARIAIANPRNAVYVSSVCFQEIVIKSAIGKLNCAQPILPLLAANKFTALPITPEHALAMAALPPHHRDPFDRQLLAQCAVEGLRLVTRDGRLGCYDVPQLAA
jgi:PIN domain nuclease of toxin-antitoxin system